MPWRVLDVGNRQWKVSLAAERRANSQSWCLVLSFRSNGPEPRTFWTTYPIESSSRSGVFTLAETIPDDKLAAVVADHAGSVS